MPPLRVVASGWLARLAARVAPREWGRRGEMVKETSMAKYTTDRRLWLNADRSKVVEDGDPDAAFLLAGKGKEVDATTVERYGLGKPKAAAKQVSGPPEDKSLKAPQTKAKG